MWLCKHIAFFILTIGALSWPSVSFSADDLFGQQDMGSGNWLERLCTAHDEGSRGACAGFILGAVDATSAVERRDGIAKRYCAPRNAEVGQMARVILKWLADHPEDLHYDASSLVITALINAWPCAQG